MTVRANKPAFSIREKLKELDYAHVPYGKMPAGTIVSTTYWRIEPFLTTTAGSWTYTTAPTGAATYAVKDRVINKKFADSKIVGFAIGAIDGSGTSTGTPTVVSLTNGVGSGANNGGTIYGAAYRHMRVQNVEPVNASFAFEDDMSNQDDPLNPHYYLRVHSSGTSISFSRFSSSGGASSTPYTLIFWEVVQ